MLDRVFPDFVLERLDVVVDGVGRELFDQLREDRDRLGVEIDLLEIRVEKAVQRHDLPVGALAGAGQPVAAAIGDARSRRGRLRHHRRPQHHPHARHGAVFG